MGAQGDTLGKWCRILLINRLRPMDFCRCDLASSASNLSTMCRGDTYLFAPEHAAAHSIQAAATGFDIYIFGFSLGILENAADGPKRFQSLRDRETERQTEKERERVSVSVCKKQRTRNARKPTVPRWQPPARATLVPLMFLTRASHVPHTCHYYLLGKP